MRDVTVRVQRVKTDRLKYKLIFFSTLALLLIIGAFFSEYLCPYDPYEQNLAIAKAAPSAEHLLGTDRFGRDMLSRIIAGSYTSIFSTLLLVGFITVFGSLIGIICAWSGKWIDTIMMRLADMFLAFPGLVFALAVAAVLGGGVHNAILALAAIARALAIQPKLLILDEATSALDVTVQAEILSLLDELQKNLNMSYLFICHDIALVQDFCDRVMVMHHGKIVEMGTTDEVIQHPKQAYTKKLIDSVL